MAGRVVEEEASVLFSELQHTWASSRRTSRATDIVEGVAVLLLTVLVLVLVLEGGETVEATASTTRVGVMMFRHDHGPSATSPSGRSTYTAKVEGGDIDTLGATGRRRNG